jgi:predicted ribosomally synthesized peptide with nif11-like leader
MPEKRNWLVTCRYTSCISRAHLRNATVLINAGLPISRKEVFNIFNKEEYFMSIESAKAYIERMKTDEDFRKKVTDCKDTEARKAFVMKEGYDFSKEDMEMVKVELGDDDLEAVVGGEKICGILPPYFIIEG